jgi:hypothetical protein
MSKCSFAKTSDFFTTNKGTNMITDGLNKRRGSSIHKRGENFTASSWQHNQTGVSVRSRHGLTVGHRHINSRFGGCTCTVSLDLNGLASRGDVHVCGVFEVLPSCERSFTG